MNKYRLRCVLLALALALAAGSVGCGDETPSDPTPDVGADAGDTSTDTDDTISSCEELLEASDAEAAPVTAAVNGWAVTVDEVTGEWSVTPPGDEEPVLTGPGSCQRDAEEWARVARVATGEPSVRGLFGNFDIDLDPAQSDIDWTAVENVVPQVIETGDGVVIRWGLGGGFGPDNWVELRFEAEGEANLSVDMATSVEEITTAEVAWNCRPDESFFGLGSQVTGMDLRGRTYPLWTQEQGNGKPEDGGVYPLQNTPEAAYAPMGVWHSSAGYSAIIGHDLYSEIDLCESSPGRVYLRSHRQMPSFVLVAGDTPRDRLGAVTEYTGRLSPEPPAWVFGTWVDAVKGPWRVEEVATTLRDNDVPASAIWTEDWIGGEATPTGFRLSYEWSWDEQTYPDLPSRIDGLHDDGFAFLGYFNPFVPTTVSTFEEARQNGYLVENQDGEVYLFQDPAFRNASMIDLSNPDAVAWLQGFQKTAARDLGIDGWMADFAEWLPVDAVLDSGEAGWEFHNRYPLAWQQANRASLEEVHADEAASNNWNFFVRSGWASVNGGTAGAAPAMWAGDQDTDWEYDDGFPTIIPIGAHLGMSGVAIYGSDIAGYNSLGTTNTDKELFFRWSATGAFHPLMRTHHGGDKCENWHFDRDAETLAHFRRWASVHTLLYPYFEEMVAEATDAGLPMTRHPYLVEPDRPALWRGDQYQYFLGDDLLVAPVLAEGETERAVLLPGEGWWPLFATSAVANVTEVDGNAVSTTVTAAVTEIPVFVRPGSALLLLGDAVDSLYGSNSPEVTDLGDVDGSYRLALYPDTSGDVALGGYDALSASGAGWNTPESLDWTGAAVDGAALPECSTPTDADTSCVDTAAGVARLYNVGDATLTVDSASLDISASAPTDVLVGVGRAAWGEWAEPTEVTSLTNDAPSWCEGASE